MTTPTCRYTTPTASRPPEWLDRLLKIPFYVGKCTIHQKQYNTTLCCACMEAPVCGACWEGESNQHDGDHHPVLQVRIGSRRACIKVEDIGKFVDITEIHRYIINGNTVVFLNPNKAPVPDASHNLICLTCRTKFVQDRVYNFCSIACKFESRRLGMETEDKSDEIVREGGGVECYKTMTTTTMVKNDIGDQCCSSFTSDCNDIDYRSCSIKFESSDVEREDKGEETVRERVKCKMMMKKNIGDQCCKSSRKGIPRKAPFV